MEKSLLLLAFLSFEALAQAQSWLLPNSQSITFTFDRHAITLWLDDYISDPGYLDTISPLMTDALWRYNYSPGGQRVAKMVHTRRIDTEDSLKVALLLHQAEAILEQNTAEFVLLNVLCSHLAEPDFYEFRFLETFPITLDLHIERKSSYAIAARALKKRYFPERD